MAPSQHSRRHCPVHFLHTHMTWPCQMVQRSKVGCISLLVLCPQYWKVPKKATPQIYAPQSKMELGRAWLSAMPAISSNWEGASWCSSLLCTGVHPAHHPGKNKGGWASHVLPSESIPGFPCRLHLLNNLQVSREIPIPSKIWSQWLHPQVSSGVKTLPSLYRRMNSHRKYAEIGLRRGLISDGDIEVESFYTILWKNLGAFRISKNLQSVLKAPRIHHEPWCNA